MPTRTRLKSSTVPFVLILVGVLTGMYFARDVLIPVAMAILLTFLLAPLVRRLERVRVPRFGAVLVVLAMTAVLVAGLGWVVEIHVIDLIEKLPSYKTNVVAKLERIRPSNESMFRHVGTLIEDLERTISPPDAEPPVEALDRHEAARVQDPRAGSLLGARFTSLADASRMLVTLLAPLAKTGIVVVFTGFMLVKREDLRNRLIRLIGEREIHRTTVALDDAAQRVSRYLVAQSMINGVYGVTIALGLWLLGVPSAALWGILAGIFRFVPYVGVWIAALLPIGLSVAASPGWTQPLLVVGFIASVEVVLSNVIEPIVIASGTGLSSFAMLMAAVFWAWLWGPVGLLLAAPLTVCLGVLGRHVRALRFLDVLLGDEPVLTLEARFYQRLLAGDLDEASKLASVFAKGRTLTEFYDGLLLPTLRLVEIDRHRGRIDGAREELVWDQLRRIMGDHALNNAGEVKPVSMRDRADEDGLVLCVPVRDTADEIAAQMLTTLLEGQGIRAEVLSAELMTGESLLRAEERGPSLVCVSAVPPRAGMHTRVLCKRLRARFPQLPLVAGLWVSEEHAMGAKRYAGMVESVSVDTSLGAVVELIRSRRSLRPAKEATLPLA